MKAVLMGVLTVALLLALTAALVRLLAPAPEQPRCVQSDGVVTCATDEPEHAP